MTADLNRGVTEHVGTELEGAEVATFTGTQGADELIGQASVMVARPASGETVEISAESGQTYVLDFDPSQARVVIDGDNLILIFADGGQIIFENLGGLAQLENGPSLQHAGADMTALLIGQGCSTAWN